VTRESAESKGGETATSTTRETEATTQGGGTDQDGRENGWVGQTRPPTIVNENELLPKSTSLANII